MHRTWWIACVLAASLGLAQAGVLPRDSKEQVELVFWDSIKDSSQASDYEAYLQTYPNGRFVALAKARLARLRASAPKPAPSSGPSDTGSSSAGGRPGATVEKPAPKKTAPPTATRAPAVPSSSGSSSGTAAPASSPASAPPVPHAAPAKGEFKDCPDCPAMIPLPAGSFTMGSNSSDPSEKPAHAVAVRKSFAIGKHEVTAAQWNACATAGACPRIAGEGDAPVRDVSWDDAQAYVGWLAKTSGQPYRLPTEAEWEYAARGGTTSRYWWGEQMQKGKADCKECGGAWKDEAPAAVGSYPPNPWGVHDVAGGVWEWVQDCWHNNYKGAPADAHAWEEKNCRVRVIRGGSWRDGAAYMMSTTRFKYDASVRQSQNGFRVARDMK